MEEPSGEAGEMEYPDPEEVGATGGPIPPGPSSTYYNESRDDLVLINQKLSSELQRVRSEVADYENRSEKESNIIKAIANMSRCNEELRGEVDKLVGGLSNYANKSRDRESKIEEWEMRGLNMTRSQTEATPLATDTQAATTTTKAKGGPGGPPKGRGGWQWPQRGRYDRRFTSYAHTRGRRRPITIRGGNRRRYDNNGQQQTCYVCQRPGHQAWQCHYNRRGPPAGGRGAGTPDHRCFRCQRHGHRAATCYTEFWQRREQRNGEYAVRREAPPTPGRVAEESDFRYGPQAPGGQY